MRFSYTLLFLSFAVLGLAQTFPSGFNRIRVGDAGGANPAIANPTVMAFAPDGRIFVGQQGGNLRVIKNNQLLTTPFVTLSVNASGERGLIGVALDPDFASNQFIYVYYTLNTSPARNRISRFTANGDVALAGSEVIILELDALSGATNHNGGALAFGTDGRLYVAVGDNANTTTPQNLDTYHGKMLRINKDGSAPADNPFNTGSPSAQRQRVWSYGLRNPYTFAVQPVTGRIFVNEVGQNAWEEINDASAGGRNFGWPSTEGPTTNPSFTSPVYAYAHTGAQPTGCAITGGTFFNPEFTTYPTSYIGKYFFQDYCSGWIYYIDPTVSNPTPVLFASGVGGNSLSLTTGPDGNLYYLSRSNQALYRIVSTNATQPVITTHPQSQTVAEGSSVTLSVTATGTTPLAFQWQRNNVNITGATEASYTISPVQLTDGASYRVRVTNQAGAAISNAATLTVNPNAKPIATITAPVGSLLYSAGTNLNFSGTGMDAEDGELPANAFSWEVNFHHDTHFHDQPPITGVKSGVFAIPNSGETSSNVWYRFILTVTDSRGAAGKDTVDVFPRKSQMTFVTVPPGLQVTLDGQPQTTPFTVTSVEGLLRDIGVVTPQVSGNDEFDFSAWLHGGAPQQTVTTPVDDVTFTATFNLIVGVVPADEAVFYPVPANEWLFIPTSLQEDIRFVDVCGRTYLRAVERHGKQNRVDVRDLPDGLYLIAVPDKPYAKIFIRH